MGAFLLRAVALATLALSAACSPVVTTHGTPMARLEAADVTPGVDTRGSVRRALGQPVTTSLVDGETWFFVSTVIEKEAYFAPRVVDRKILAVRFDDLGVVTDASGYGLEDGQVVALRAETTPTFGRELTVVQQIFGNIGRVSPGELTGNR